MTAIVGVRDSFPRFVAIGGIEIPRYWKIVSTLRVCQDNVLAHAPLQGMLQLAQSQLPFRARQRRASNRRAIMGR